MGSTVDLCSGCNLEVRPRQHALICDRFSCWRHRTCGTSVSQSMYWQISRELKAGKVFMWYCPDCPDSMEVSSNYNFYYFTTRFRTIHGPYVKCIISFLYCMRIVLIFTFWQYDFELFMYVSWSLCKMLKFFSIPYANCSRFYLFTLL